MTPLFTPELIELIRKAARNWAEDDPHDDCMVYRRLQQIANEAEADNATAIERVTTQG